MLPLNVAVLSPYFVYFHKYEPLSMKFKEISLITIGDVELVKNVLINIRYHHGPWKTLPPLSRTNITEK